MDDARDRAAPPIDLTYVSTNKREDHFTLTMHPAMISFLLSKVFTEAKPFEVVLPDRHSEGGQQAPRHRAGGCRSARTQLRQGLRTRQHEDLDVQHQEPQRPRVFRRLLHKDISLAFNTRNQYLRTVGKSDVTNPSAFPSYGSVLLAAFCFTAQIENLWAGQDSDEEPHCS